MYLGSSIDKMFWNMALPKHSLLTGQCRNNLMLSWMLRREVSPPKAPEVSEHPDSANGV